MTDRVMDWLFKCLRGLMLFSIMGIVARLVKSDWFDT